MINSFADIPNPQEAAKAIQSFLRSFKTKTCMSASAECTSKIVDAHTLSKQAMLRPICRDGHVYSLTPDMYNPAASVATKLELTGISETSTFSGFCSFHDKSLFACIEDQAFVCHPEQIFMLAYRAIAREAYLKRRQAESLLPMETVRKIHAIPDDIELELSIAGRIYVATSLRGAEDIERSKAQMDYIRLAGDYFRLQSVVIPFVERPPIAANFVFAPEKDFAGRLLQDFADFDRDLDPLFVTLCPYESGGYKGFMVLSFLTDRSTAPKAFIDSLLLQPDFESSVSWFIAVHTENFAINPAWFEELNDAEKESLCYAIKANVDFAVETQAELHDPLISVASWERRSEFWI